MALLKNTLSSVFRIVTTKLHPLITQPVSKQILQSSILKCKCNRFIQNIQPAQSSGFHTSCRRSDLSEFLDSEKNWAQETVKVGRPWKLDELRIKSNEDLHKLWYILLKERNMLLTMEAEYKRQCELFPSPERIFKVEESMEKLLSVVRERNQAYNLLETGQTGEPGGDHVRNFLGLKVYRKFREHYIPKHMNKRYQLLHPKYRKSMVKYILLYKEQQRIKRMKKEKSKRRTMKSLLEKYPDLRNEQN